MIKEANPDLMDQALIPIVVDVKRNIDNHIMVRCSYYSIQSDKPMPNWTIQAGGTNEAMLLLNLESILIGNPNKASYHFGEVSDVEMMYDFVEKENDLFVDINEIWVPIEWFGGVPIKQGYLFRIHQVHFSWCWQLRNDIISSDEFYSKSLDDENLKSLMDREPIVKYSEKESEVFKQWTEKQINRSREIYQANKENYLEKISG